MKKVLTDSSEHITSVWCGSKEEAQQHRKKSSLYLNSLPPDQNVFLKAENISRKLAQNIPSIAYDLLEVASYIYSTDQSKSRGGKTFPNDGQNWYRQYELNIPVRNPDLWNQRSVKDSLTKLMRFISDDNYKFTFRRLGYDIPKDAYFDFTDQGTWFNPDSILLFSGGLDSLAGAIEELSDPQRKILLVSHRPVAKIDKIQKGLVDKLIDKFDAESRILHVPVWVNKVSKITKDNTQRSRSFLYSSIACAISMMVNRREIKFYENGIISCNLPISEQLVNARASRSTHPISLKLMSEFFSSLMKEEFKVSNPYFQKTKSDVVELYKTHRATDLIKESRSCTHTRSTTILHTHCGVCSQCVERRLAVLWNGLEGVEPEEMYEIRLFQDSLNKPEDKQMVENYIQHARILEELAIESFFEKFPDCLNTMNALPGTKFEAGQALYDLHHKHGQQVGKVLEEQIALNSGTLRKGAVKLDSLLGILLGKSLSRQKFNLPPDRFPLPKGADWPEIIVSILSKDSLSVQANGITKRYSAFRIGFTDQRKEDMLNKQWDLLYQFAENHGQISVDTTEYKKGLQKHVQALNKTLKAFCGLSTNPINPYTRKDGWTTKFQIVDKTYGRN